MFNDNRHWSNVNAIQFGTKQYGSKFDIYVYVSITYEVSSQENLAGTSKAKKMNHASSGL